MAMKASSESVLASGGRAFARMAKPCGLMLLLILATTGKSENVSVH